MGDYTDRSSPAEMCDDSVLSGDRIHPKHQIQVELPEVSISDELQAAADASNDEGEIATRTKTGGRTKGTPNKVARVDIAKVARVYSLRALEVLISVMEDKKEAGSTRIAAANALLDRAHGKPKQVTEVGGFDGGDIQTKLTIEFVGQPPIKATVDAQLTQDDGKTIDMQLQTVRVPEQRRPWDPE
jgi:hypothetical protein